MNVGRYLMVFTWHHVHFIPFSLQHVCPSIATNYWDYLAPVIAVNHAWLRRPGNLSDLGDIGHASLMISPDTDLYNVIKSLITAIFRPASRCQSSSELALLRLWSPAVIGYSLSTQRCKIPLPGGLSRWPADSQEAPYFWGPFVATEGGYVKSAIGRLSAGKHCSGRVKSVASNITGKLDTSVTITGLRPNTALIMKVSLTVLSTSIYSQ